MRGQAERHDELLLGSTALFWLLSDISDELNAINCRVVTRRTRPIFWFEPDRRVHWSRCAHRARRPGAWGLGCRLLDRCSCGLYVIHQCHWKGKRATSASSESKINAT